MQWFTTAEVAERLRTTREQVQLLCQTGQIAWRPQNPSARRRIYLISDEAIAAYEEATTRPATIRPLRR
ncbi:hypothetical protein FHX74_002549 [Friedmanniella endophytica]|uniref:Helix-turn-helix domain-containing protein n=1 Tax=Microlunatus kandeliicorticis TaxID=1759536 RepID=A0A7W3ITF2_9ACTN|nr:hypothetical protein [Microlunatus kandeliicorticis]MBA8794921.1 hypothetical protein [Microlunatus kandeliicorticis]